MKTTITAFLKKARLEVPAEDWDSVQRLAVIIFGLTPSDTNETRAAAWALHRAAAIVPALRKDAYTALPVKQGAA